jgi:hypothetical protein
MYSYIEICRIDVHIGIVEFLIRFGILGANIVTYNFNQVEKVRSMGARGSEPHVYTCIFLVTMNRCKAFRKSSAFLSFAAT